MKTYLVISVILALAIACDRKAEEPTADEPTTDEPTTQESETSVRSTSGAADSPVPEKQDFLPVSRPANPAPATEPADLPLAENDPWRQAASDSEYMSLATMRKSRDWREVVLTVGEIVLEDEKLSISRRRRSKPLQVSSAGKRHLLDETGAVKLSGNFIEEASGGDLYRVRYGRGDTRLVSKKSGEEVSSPFHGDDVDLDHVHYRDGHAWLVEWDRDFPDMLTLSYADATESKATPPARKSMEITGRFSTESLGRWLAISLDTDDPEACRLMVVSPDYTARCVDGLEWHDTLHIDDTLIGVSGGALVRYDLATGKTSREKVTADSGCELGAFLGHEPTETFFVSCVVPRSTEPSGEDLARVRTFALKPAKFDVVMQASLPPHVGWNATTDFSAGRYRRVAWTDGYGREQTDRARYGPSTLVVDIEGAYTAYPGLLIMGENAAMFVKNGRLALADLSAWTFEPIEVPTCDGRWKVAHDGDDMFHIQCLDFDPSSTKGKEFGCGTARFRARTHHVHHSEIIDAALSRRVTVPGARIVMGTNEGVYATTGSDCDHAEHHGKTLKFFRFDTDQAR